jgi:hypothetical protein
MKVIHLIPSAFHYFDDIRDRAMALVNAERKLGIVAEAYTLQYGATTKRDEISVSQKMPGLNFHGMFGNDDIIKDLDNYDIVHLHCPFFGLAKDLLAWKKNNPDKILAVSNWRKVIVIDLFSIFIALYNRYFLPKITRLADGNTADIHLTLPANELKLNNLDTEAEACLSFYSILLQKNYGKRAEEKHF